MTVESWVGEGDGKEDVMGSGGHVRERALCSRGRFRSFSVNGHGGACRRI